MLKAVPNLSAERGKSAVKLRGQYKKRLPSKKNLE